MHTVPGLHQPSAAGGVRRLSVMLMTLVFLSACAPSDQKVEELSKEIQSLKTQIAATQEKLNQVQAGQQAILDLLKKPEAAPALQASPAPPPVVAPSLAPAPEPLTVGRTSGQQRPLPGHPGEGKGDAGPGHGAP